MDNTGWLRQTETPLFEDLLWSRPQNKRASGKLLIIGGHSHSFRAVSSAFAAATKAGAGAIRVMLPDSLQKTLGRAFAEAEFVASTPVGSLSQTALGQALDLSEWADGVLLAGDFGRNSETAILLDKFVAKYRGPIILAGDGLDCFYRDPAPITDRRQTVLCAEIGQLQKLALPQVAIRQNDDFVRLLDTVRQWATTVPVNLLIPAQQIIVAAEARISTTKIRKPVSTTELGAYAAVWTIQQPGRLFEALTTAAYCSMF